MRRKLPAITAEDGYDSCKIKINGVMHIAFRRSEFRGLQSWRWNASTFCIEITLTGGAAITTEYDDARKWHAVLALLEARV